MPRKRVAILGFRHEAMMSCPFLTDDSTTLFYYGDDILGLPLTTVTGTTDLLREQSDIVIVPLVFVRCLPGGGFSRETYAKVKNESLRLLREQGPFDGLMVLNHGAAEVDGLGVHGDTDYIVAIRELVGPDVPIAVPFDMHGQVTQALLDALTVMSCLRTAPHRDNYETSRRATEQLLAVMRGAAWPKKAAIHIPIMAPGEKVMSDYSPARELFGMLAELDARPGIGQAVLFVGFGWNDLPWCGMKAVVLADDERLALRTAEEIAAKVWDARQTFDLYMETAGVRDGLERARDDGRKAIYLSDSGDNVTAGAGGDLTFVLQEALDLGLTDVVVAGIFAPDLVTQCRDAGVGKTVALEIGQHVSARPQPRRVAALVEALGDKVDTLRYQNLRESNAPWARVRIGGAIVTFHAARVGFTGPGHLEAVGIDPSAHSIYVVKVGYAHPEQEDMLTRHICLISEGVADLDFTRLPYRRIPRPCYPLERDMTWTPRQGVFDNNRHLIAA
ncbi:MAG: M81 family metallopeptidase [Acetobacteraceae bacterium]|nr:M81 family metallopeptidase [Acetobacteraceae bacterium]